MAFFKYISSTKKIPEQFKEFQNRWPPCNSVDNQTISRNERQLLALPVRLGGLDIGTVVERGSFTPIVFSACGGLGREINHFVSTFVDRYLKNVI